MKMGNDKLSIKQICQFNSNPSNNNKGIYFGLWKFNDFVSSIKFTHREPLNYKIFRDNLEMDMTKKYPEFNHDYYQRLINDDRTKKVILFLINQLTLSFLEKKDPLTTFPTSLILSTYISDFTEELDYIKSIRENNSENFNEEIGVYFDKENESLLLPKLNIMLIVDGQHRLAGILAIYEAVKMLLGNEEVTTDRINEKLIEYAKKKIESANFPDLLIIKDSIENFQFACTLLLDFDIWEQGKVFADVNFNQKPVNKSLYYDIFGSYPDPDRNDLYLAHTWTVFLNSVEDSPFFNKIKMLGNGKGYFSQAFFVEALFPLLRKNGIWNDLVSDYITTNAKPEFIPIFLKNYFNAIKEVYVEYWPQEDTKPSSYKNILYKTTGLGALVKLINLVFPLIEKELLSNEVVLKERIKNIFVTEITAGKLNSRLDDYVIKIKHDQKLNDIAKSNLLSTVELDRKNIQSKITGEYYFSKDGGFSKGAGKGLQDKLFKELAFDLGLSKTK